METNLKFNADACYGYIDSIDDFVIEFETKPAYDEESETRTYFAENIEVKSFLRGFMLRCNKESQKEEYDFLRWLRGRRGYWNRQKYQVIGCLSDKLQTCEADEQAGLEKKMLRYSAFYRHNYRLIEMIIGDVMNNYDRSVRQTPPDNNKVMFDKTAVDDFNKLFKEGIDAEPYFQLLRDHEYPLIGVGYNYISKALKSGFCIWIYELQRQNLIEHQPDMVYAKLLLNTIIGLKAFDESIFRKTNNKADSRYKEYFNKKVAEVKLAQDSQSAHL